MKKVKVKRNYFIKVFSGHEVDKYRTRSIRRFLNFVRTINWKKTKIEVYLRVSDGYKISGSTAYNDGSYNKKKDFTLAQKAFLET